MIFLEHSMMNPGSPAGMETQIFSVFSPSAAIINTTQLVFSVLVVGTLIVIRSWVRWILISNPDSLSIPIAPQIPRACTYWHTGQQHFHLFKIFLPFGPLVSPSVYIIPKYERQPSPATQGMNRSTGPSFTGPHIPQIVFPSVPIAIQKSNSISRKQRIKRAAQGHSIYFTNYS